MGIVLELIPVSRQVTVPLPPLQTRVLAALAALGPMTTLLAVKSAVGMSNVHWSPAG